MDEKIVNELIEELIKLSFAEDIGDGDHTTLCCIPADAIGKHLDFGRKRWFAFTSIWGEKNYSDLLSKAIECDNAKNLGRKVKELFPEYEVPEPYTMR